VSGRAGRWIRRTTIGCVALLAVIAGTVSYLHMHALVALQGQPGWVATLTPLSVDGMIVAASTTLLADSRSGCAGRGRRRGPGRWPGNRSRRYGLEPIAIVSPGDPLPATGQTRHGPEISAGRPTQPLPVPGVTEELGFGQDVA
jgi:hypothetical protein